MFIYLLNEFSAFFIRTFFSEKVCNNSFEPLPDYIVGFESDMSRCRTIVGSESGMSRCQNIVGLESDMSRAGLLWVRSQT